MSMPSLRAPLLCLALAGVAATPAVALSLYDPSLGSLPGAQGWSTAASGGLGSQAVVGGMLQFDSTGIAVSAFGHGRTAPQVLDTVAGFTLHWQLQIRNEVHSSDNRAGFSLLVQGADQTQALELGFWQDSVWALGYSPGGADSGFVRAATAAIDTTAGLRSFSLTVAQNSFSLAADGVPLLSGALRDYPTLGLSTLPYGFSSYLFFGDNSSRGESVAQIGAIDLLPVPEPATVALWAAGLGLLAWRQRRR